jgi:hypothetical protein
MGPRSGIIISQTPHKLWHIPPHKLWHIPASHRTAYIESWLSQQPLVGSYPNFKLRLRWPKQSVQILQLKMTSHGRRPQNIRSGISQQLLIGSYSNFKFQLILPKSILYQSFKWWRHPTEDDLKILKVEYLGRPLLNHTQILSLSVYEQTIFCQSFKWRRPLMEDALEILKVECLSNHLLDHTQILNLC